MRKLSGTVIVLLLAMVPMAQSIARLTSEVEQASRQQFPDISLKLVTSALSQPVGVTTAGDGSKKLFVIQQHGLILIVKRGEPNGRPFLDITHLTDANGEQGLLGLAFHPSYDSNRRFFVHYTAANGDTVIAQFKRTRPNTDTANEESERILLRVEDPYSNHNGGDLHFGSDGYLYIALGDGGGGGDPKENGQALDTLLGKILRIDVNGTEASMQYAIPDDNPFVGVAGARPEIWNYGLRNPWRFSFDSATGDIWIGDVGQNAIEEIDVGRAGSQRGLNYGWDIMEGSSCFEPEQGCDSTGLTLPVAEYSHNEGCSVTGGYVYRGQRFPDLEGIYFYGDYCSGSIWALSAADPTMGATKVLSTDNRISSFGTNRGGELLVTDHGGRLFKIEVAQ
jgi:glucose/arabinose dehydrogenase